LILFFLSFSSFLFASNRKFKMDTVPTKKGLSGGVNQINSWFDQLLPQSSLLPHQHQQQQQESTKHTILKSRWFRLSIVVYILFSILLTAAHVTSWLFSGSSSSHYYHTSRSARDALSYQRTYDAGKSSMVFVLMYLFVLMYSQRRLILYSVTCRMD